METQNTKTEVFESIGSSVRSEIAHRIGEDRWFKRSQYRDARFGYKWTPWTTTALRPGVVYNGGRSRELQLFRVLLGVSPRAQRPPR